VFARTEPRSVDRQPRPLALFLSLTPTCPEQARGIPHPHPLSPFPSNDCRLTSPMAVSQPFAHQSLSHSFHCDGGYTLPLGSKSRHSPLATAFKSLPLNLFADPHPLTPITSIFYKKGRGRGPISLTLSHYPLTSSSPSPLAATLMDLPTSVANKRLNSPAKRCRCNTYKGNNLLDSSTGIGYL